MLNNNLADISTFESIQSDQHAKTGMSSMSVFNDLNKVKDLSVKFKSAVDNYVDSHLSKAKAIYDTYSDAVKKQGELKPDDPLVKKMQDMKDMEKRMRKELLRVAEPLLKEVGKERRAVNKSLDADEPGSLERKEKTNAVIEEVQKTQRQLKDAMQRTDSWFGLSSGPVKIESYFRAY
ncbi:MAG: hypothetical protein LBP87_10380 [Planctomycetaceae bacterium]|jgi:phosphoenolpyruvate-protein kinase (PTS system EI component)|nr:hypothetical protein [Planctomycetaceae bacterium]